MREPVRWGLLGAVFVLYVAVDQLLGPPFTSFLTGLLVAGVIVWWRLRGSRTKAPAARPEDSRLAQLRNRLFVCGAVAAYLAYGAIDLLRPRYGGFGDAAGLVLPMALLFVVPLAVVLVVMAFTWRSIRRLREINDLYATQK